MWLLDYFIKRKCRRTGMFCLRDGQDKLDSLAEQLNSIPAAFGADSLC
jgi:hypothetical protein